MARGSKTCSYRSKTLIACDMTDRDFSFGGWFKLQMISSTTSIIMGRTPTSAGGNYCYLSIDSSDSKIRGNLVGNSGLQATIALLGITPNSSVWQFLVLTYNKALNQLEVRFQIPAGALQKIVAPLTCGAINTVPSITNFVIGEALEGDSTFYSVNRNGVLACDECFFVNKALTDADFAYLFNGGVGKTYAQLTSDAAVGVTAPDVRRRALISHAPTVWMLVILTYNKTGNLLECRLRAVGAGAMTKVTAALVGAIFTGATNANFYIGERCEADGTFSGTNLNGVLQADECFFVNKAIVDTEFDYLYNAGAGKTYSQLMLDAVGIVASPTVDSRSLLLYASSANQTPTLAAGIVAGNLLLHFFTVVSTSTITGWSVGWSKIYEVVNAANTFRMAIFAKIATGSDALTINLSAASVSGHADLYLSGSIGSVFDQIAVVSAASSLDPPSNTPAHGATSYTAIAALGWINATNITAYPAGYTGGLSAGLPTAGKTSVGVANKYLSSSATTEDPGAFTGGMRRLDCR